MSDLIKSSIAFIEAVVRYFKAVSAAAEYVAQRQSENLCHCPEFRARLNYLSKKAGIR